jgi:1-pyrroline-5-carboxylate dehydrogenase
VGAWATVDPDGMGVGGTPPARGANLVGGAWTPTAATLAIPDPMTGATMIECPATSSAEAGAFVASLAACPKSGLHNPIKNPHRYAMYGEVTARAAAELARPEVERFFARLVQRTSPKSTAQATAEVVVTRRFLDNFGGDQPRFTAAGRVVAGDHAGQASTAHRWPYGPVGLITPFNFPLEIPALQLLGALYMGNKPLLHVDRRVAIVCEQFVRLLHACGAPTDDVDVVNGHGPVVTEILAKAGARSTLFTGSRRVAETLSTALGGRVFLEDAGFDWKVLGPDVGDVDYVAWQADQDAYACSGQKCSAQSILFVHDNWAAAGLEDRMRERAARRTLADLTVGPVLTWTTDAMLAHVAKLASIPGARVAWGGTALEGHTIPKEYGAITPTAVEVPLAALADAAHFAAVTTEVFGPVQVIVRWGDGDLGAVLAALERMDAHLTAAVVSNDPLFVNEVLGSTVNGTTYAGRRARTTGAPQNHWFGPAGDPRGAGIGTPEAIRLVWSCHREIITDVGPAPEGGGLVTT